MKNGPTSPMERLKHLFKNKNKDKNIEMKKKKKIVRVLGLMPKVTYATFMLAYISMRPSYATSWQKP
jgi:hypothetical protein